MNPTVVLTPRVDPWNPYSLYESHVDALALWTKELWDHTMRQFMLEFHDATDEELAEFFEGYGKALEEVDTEA